MRKDRKDEDEAKALLKEMLIDWWRPRPDPLQVCGRFDENMRTWDEDRGRPNFIMDKIWQMLRSNDTKTLNLNKDFEELLDLVQQARWVVPTKPREYWTKEKIDE